MRRIMLPLAVLVTAASLSPPAVAADREVQLFDAPQRFEPAIRQADPGDLVRWVWSGQHGLSHNVTAYQGASFKSEDLNNVSGPVDFTATFPGGVVRYRCTLHSTLDAQGRCNGMCGVLAADTTPPAAPQITSPVDGSITGAPVRFTGSAPGAARVDLFEGAALRARVPVDDGSGWQANVNLSDGEHTIDAVAVSGIGVESQPTRLTFDVDRTAPVVTISEPGDPSIGSTTVTVGGVASDDRALVTVTVTVRDPIGRTVADRTFPHTGGDFVTTFEVPPGVYEVRATARDLAGNPSAAAVARVLLL